MKAGDLVKNKVVIQSDDRSMGLEDATPIIPVGTTGVIRGNSADFLEPGNKLKSGCDGIAAPVGGNCLQVAFAVAGATWNYDVTSEELELV